MHAEVSQASVKDSSENYQCECCGYEIHGMYGRLFIHGKTWVICGDCISFMWQGRHWAHQEPNPTKIDKRSWVPWKR